MSGTVPADITTTMQTELGVQLATAEARLSQLTAGDADSRALIDEALKLLGDSASGYLTADPGLRRAYNQTWYEHILIDDDVTAIRVADATHSAVIEPVYSRARRLAAVNDQENEAHDIVNAKNDEIALFSPLGIHDLSNANGFSREISDSITPSKYKKIAGTLAPAFIMSLVQTTNLWWS